MASAERAAALVLLAAALSLRCRADDDAAPGANLGGRDVGGPDASGAGGGASGAAGAAGGGFQPDAAPPERELEGAYRTPIATGRYVWTANPESGKVALIDASSLQVRLTDAGFGPTYLAAVPEPGNADA